MMCCVQRCCCAECILGSAIGQTEVMECDMAVALLVCCAEITPCLLCHWGNQVANKYDIKEKLACPKAFCCGPCYAMQVRPLPLTEDASKGRPGSVTE